MVEVRGNLWDYPANVRVVTTNGATRSDGKAVMGRGCAREAKERYPGVDSYLGLELQRNGNHVTALMDAGDWLLLSYPVKHHWKQLADPELIVRSAHELVAMVTPDDVVVMPRPGCGNGGLRWEDIKPLLEPILDDRFHVITF